MDQPQRSAWTGFAPAAVDVEHRADASIVLRSPQPLGAHAARLGEHLERWAGEAPQRVFLAERRAGAWQRSSYSEVLAQVRRIAAALLARGLCAERPLVILSDNGVKHALLTLAAMHVGVPAAPVSPAYSLMSQDHAKLRAILALLRPGLVYADSRERYAAALAAIDLAGIDLVCDDNFDELTRAEAGPDVDRAFAATGPDTVAKILFTSGSTGLPKGVINTQRMLCSNQQAIAQLWPFLDTEPPVIVDWLPWNHTFGGNHNFNMVLRNGGSLYLDEGKPVAGLVERTTANLADISPTLYFNVPRGFDMLIPLLEADARLRDNFFRRLKLIFYAAAALPQHLWQRLDALALAARGEPVAMLSAWGSTETAPLCTGVHFPIPHAGVIGLPAPGTEIKMLPNNGKLELRVRGPNVTPGYFRQPELTAAAFDEEGFYRIGDAGRFADAGDPARGIEFDGRIAEDFKLASGVFVHVGALRVKAVAALAPVAQDIVVTGHDRDEVGFLVFASPGGCRAMCPDLAPDAPLAQVLADPRVVASVQAGMVQLARDGGSSMHATRVLLMDEPASIDAGEITDKGYINQRATLARRAALVERLYAGGGDPALILLPAKSR